MYTYLLEGHSILTHAWVQFIRFLVNQSFWQVDKSPGHYLAFVFCCTATIRNLGLLHLINFVWVGPHKSSGKFHTRWGLRDKCLNCWREKRCQHQRMSTPFMEVAERWSHSRTMFNFTNFTLTYSNIVLQQVLDYHDDHVKENTKSKAYTAPCKLCLFHKILNIPKHTLARKYIPLYPRQVWTFDMVSAWTCRQRALQLHLCICGQLLTLHNFGSSSKIKNLEWTHKGL